MKDFAGNLKVREIIMEEIAPTVNQFQVQSDRLKDMLVRTQEKANQLLKFQTERGNLQKNVKEIRNEKNSLECKFLQYKGETDVFFLKKQTQIQKMKEDVMAMQRNLARRDQTLLSYDTKLNSAMESLSKRQAKIIERVNSFEERFRELVKQTFNVSQQAKKQLDQSAQKNQTIKKQLQKRLNQVKQNQKKLETLASESQQLPKMINELSQQIKQSQSKRNEQLEQLRKTLTAEIENMISPQLKDHIQNIGLKFAQIQQLQHKSRKSEELMNDFKKLSVKVQTLERKRNADIQLIKQENDKIYQRVSEIDRKMQTIEDNIQQTIKSEVQAQTRGRIQQKVQQLKQFFQAQLSIIKAHQNEVILQLKNHVKSNSNTSSNNNQNSHLSQKFAENLAQKQKLISNILAQARLQLKNIQQKFQSIAQLGDSINTRLVAFSNKITICRSDIDLISQNTTKNSKKLIDLKKDQQNLGQNIGKILSQYMQSLLMISSLLLNQQPKCQNKSFVTYRDGIILDLNNQHKDGTIVYRRNHYTPKQLKQSLLYSLMNLTDQIINTKPLLKWDINKPSEWFKSIKSSVSTITKNQSKIISARAPKISKPDVSETVDDPIFMQLRVQTQQDLEQVRIYPSNSMQISSFVKSAEKKMTYMQKGYKLKRNQDRSRVQSIQRNCFTASRSHRKTKLTYV